MAVIIRPNFWIKQAMEHDTKFDDLLSGSFSLGHLMKRGGRDRPKGERAKLERSECRQLARNCAELMMSLGLSNADVCRALADYNCPFPLNSKLIRRLTLPDDNDEKRLTDLTVDPRKYCVLIASIFVAQSGPAGRNLCEIVDDALQGTAMDPSIQEDLAPPEEMACTLEKLAESLESEFGLLEAFWNISEHYAERARLGSALDLWPYDFDIFSPFEERLLSFRSSPRKRTRAVLACGSAACAPAVNDRRRCWYACRSWLSGAASASTSPSPGRTYQAGAGGASKRLRSCSARSVSRRSMKPRGMTMWWNASSDCGKPHWSIAARD